MRVGIVGAGIGGLCAAVGLHRAGADVAEIERTEQKSAGGSGLSVFGNGLRALDSIGVGEAFRAITSPEAATYQGGQRHPDGSWLSIYPMDAVNELRVVDRAPLHEILHSALPENVVNSGARVSSARSDGQIVWRDSSGREISEKFDLVVAADGIHSRIRQSLPNDPGVTYSGYSTWRGITDIPVDLHSEAGETWGVRKRFGIAPLMDGRAYWFAVLSVNREHQVNDDRTALDEHFGTWHDPIPELIAATSSNRIGYLPIDELAGNLPSYVQGRVVLLGDAAHAMTPNLGQGGGQAMEDAATLAALFTPLADSSDPAKAEIARILTRYEGLRLKRTQTIASRSRMIGLLAHKPGAGLTGVRDLILRATPTSALRKQLAWLQDWTPPA